jgi:predicted nucleotidyltransferase
MEEGRSLFDLIALTSELETKLGIEVDVHTEAGISPYIRESVLTDSTPL